MTIRSILRADQASKNERMNERKEGKEMSHLFIQMENFQRKKERERLRIRIRL